MIEMKPKWIILPAACMILLAGCTATRCGQLAARTGISRSPVAKAKLNAQARITALKSISRWTASLPHPMSPIFQDSLNYSDKKEIDMLKMKTHWFVMPAAGLCLLAAGCSQWTPALIHRDSHTVEAITQNQPPTGPTAHNPAVVILRPAIQAAAQAAGPMGGTVLGIVAAIASLIAGATTTAAARAKSQVNRHKQAVSELARVIPPGTILHPATQRVITAATS
jgi:hypothetical protein